MYKSNIEQNMNLKHYDDAITFYLKEWKDYKNTDDKYYLDSDYGFLIDFDNDDNIMAIEIPEISQICSYKTDEISPSIHKNEDEYILCLKPFDKIVHHEIILDNNISIIKDCDNNTIGFIII